MRKERKRVGWNKARKIRWVLVVVCWEILVCEVKVVHALPTATHRHTNTHTMPFNPDQQKCNYLPEERKVCEREIMRLVWKTTSVWILIIIFSSNTPSNGTSPNRHLYISDSLHNSNKVALSDIKILDRPITKSDYELNEGPTFTMVHHSQKHGDVCRLSTNEKLLRLKKWKLGLKHN